MEFASGGPNNDGHLTKNDKPKNVAWEARSPVLTNFH